MADKELNIIIKALDEATGPIKKLGNNLEGFAKKNQATFQKMAIGGGAAFAGITAGAFKAINTAGKFQTRMSDISTLISGDSTEAIKDLSDGILQLTKSTPKSADDLGASAYSIFSAGITDTTQALKVLDDSSRLAVAGLSTTAEATNIMTSAINAFGYEAEESAKVSDILFKTVKFGKTDISQMTQAFGAAAPVIASAGISLEEFSAATAALTTSGLPASQAQNSLRQATVSLIKPTKDMAYLLEEFGYESGAAAIEQDGLVKVMENVTKTAEGNDAMIARAWGSVEALGAATALTGEQGEAFAETLKSMEGGTNEVTEAFNKQTDSIESQKQMFENSISTMSISLGNTLIPIMNDLIKTVKPIIDSTTEWITENKTLVKNLIVASGAIAGLVGVLGGLGLIIGPVVAGITALISPIGLVVAAVGGLYLAWQTNFLGIRDITEDIFEGIKAFRETWGDDITSWFKTIRESIKSIFNFGLEVIKLAIDGWVLLIKATLNRWGEDIINLFSNILDGIKNIFEFWADIFTGDWKGAWQNFKEIAMNVWEILKSSIGVVLEEIRGVIERSWNGIWDMVQNVMQSAVDVVMDKFQSLKEFINGVIGFATGAFDKVKSIGEGAKNLAGNIGSGISGAIGGVTDFVTGQRALGGPVTANRSYLVGENGPEVFTPASSGRINNNMGGGSPTININMGGVVVNNEADENRLIEKIKRALVRETQLYNNGIL